MDPLELLGLSPVEARLYRVLVSKGTLTAGRIADIAGTHRRLAYDALSRLAAKGLVSSVERNRRTAYEAVPPARLLGLFDEKRSILAQETRSLQEQWQSKATEGNVFVFEGLAGLKACFEDQLEEGKKILIIGQWKAAQSILRYYFHWFDERRKERNVHAQCIFEESARKELPAIPLASIRFLPDKFVGPTALNIYGNKVTSVLWTDKPVAVLAQSATMAESYRQFFKLLWETAK